MYRLLLTLLVLTFTFSASAGSYLPWRLGYKTIKTKHHQADIRVGYLTANPEVKFKGNILFYQGLGDSILNHDPLFEVLTNNGFRVVAFDYMGQGGSAGTMNNTTIENINEIGDKVIDLLGRKNGPNGSKYHILGWSTGGLAAYRKAYYDKGRSILSVVLIAPGIAPNYFVGEGLFNWPIDEISMETLTTNRFLGVNDPHEDPIFPKSPVFVPKFAFNLQKVAMKSRTKWFIDPKVPGLVLLSGPSDTYVNASKTKTVLKKRAKHFRVVTYSKALHEIDNEMESIAKSARENIVRFFLK